jgi:hypothetical protein
MIHHTRSDIRMEELSTLVDMAAIDKWWVAEEYGRLANGEWRWRYRHAPTYLELGLIRKGSYVCNVHLAVDCHRGRAKKTQDYCLRLRKAHESYKENNQ